MFENVNLGFWGCINLMKKWDCLPLLLVCWKCGASSKAMQLLPTWKWCYGRFHCLRWWDSKNCLGKILLIVLMNWQFWILPPCLRDCDAIYVFHFWGGAVTWCQHIVWWKCEIVNGLSASSKVLFVTECEGNGGYWQGCGIKCQNK